MSDTQQAAQNWPILGLLGLIFITLKLTGHIAWSWWWVLAPFWGPFALVAVIFGGLLLVALGAVAVEAIFKK